MAKAIANSRSASRYAATGNVDHGAGDGSAGELERRGVARRDRLSEIASHADSATGQAERERVGLHSGQGGHRGVVDVERDIAQRGVTALDGAGASVGRTQDVGAQGHRVGRGHELLLFAEEVVDEVHPAVGEEQRVAAVSGALFEQHTAGVVAIDGHLHQHRERAPGRLHRRTHRHLGGVRVVDVAGAVAGQRRPGPGHHLHHAEIAERQAVVLARLLEPQLLQLGQPVGVFARPGRGTGCGRRRCGTAPSGPGRSVTSPRAPRGAPCWRTSPCARSRGCPTWRRTGCPCRCRRPGHAARQRNSLPPAASARCPSPCRERRYPTVRRPWG